MAVELPRFSSSYLSLLGAKFTARLKDVNMRIKRSIEESRCISLKPKGPARGDVLLSYVTRPFTLKTGEPLPNTHSEFRESVEMAHTFLERGYRVDVISFQNNVFVPKKDYAFLVDSRRNLQRLSPLLNKDCVKVMHINAAHVLFHDAAQLRRLLALQQRRGVTLRWQKFEVPYWGIEHADYATILGNQFTMSTYRYANKPLYRVPITSPVLYDFPANKDFDRVRNNFVWFGSGGLVHKGLDLVLEAFAQMPEYRLTVCGPIKNEKDFDAAYHKELYETPNIRTVGWVDIGSREFIRIMDDCLGLVYPSCSEGQCGGVVTSMNGGLIPIVSFETGVDVANDYGIILKDCSIEEIRNSVRQLASLPAQKLMQMARAAWEYGRANHTGDKFGEEYRKAIDQIIAARDLQSSAARFEARHPAPREMAGVV